MPKPKMFDLLDLARCPHCGVSQPSLTVTGDPFRTVSYDQQRKRIWQTYACSKCGGVVLAATLEGIDGTILEIYPTTDAVNKAIPEPARDYLIQASDSLHAPAGCVMLCASAIDAMLKAKSYTEGNLYPRINKAADDHLITREMAQWAHDVRLDANEPRHADEESPLPTTDDARRCLDFALALGEFLFVLPARVKRGLADKTNTEAGE